MKFPSCIKDGMATKARRGPGGGPARPAGGPEGVRGLPQVRPAGSALSPGVGGPRSHGPVPVPALGADAALALQGPAEAPVQ